VVFLKSLFPKELDLSGVRLVVDCANGAGYKVAPLVFEELGAEVIRRGVSPDGTNINQDCGALHPMMMAGATVEYRADMGIALDGDADRCILSDEKGEIIDGDQILGLCALELKRQGRLGANTVVATPMSNLGLELLLKENGVKFVRAPVGDRYVVETMRKEGATLGGEQSGHLIFLEHATTGDGILGALRILEVVKRTGKTLSELKKQIPLFPQYRRDVKVGRKIPIEESAEIQAAIKRGTESLNQKGRVFVRYSGTEAVARVLVEGEDLGQIQQVTLDISATLERTLA
jgi:phosphoglucosamine mutase